MVDPIDDKIVRLVCTLVAKRAAFLAGTGKWKPSPAHPIKMNHN